MEEAGSLLILVNLQRKHIWPLGGNFSRDSSGQDATCSLMTNQHVDSELPFLSVGSPSVQMSQFRCKDELLCTSVLHDIIQDLFTHYSP